MWISFDWGLCWWLRNFLRCYCFNIFVFDVLRVIFWFLNVLIFNWRLFVMLWCCWWDLVGWFGFIFGDWFWFCLFGFLGWMLCIINGLVFLVGKVWWILFCILCFMVWFFVLFCCFGYWLIMFDFVVLIGERNVYWWWLRWMWIGLEWNWLFWLKVGNWRILFVSMMMRGIWLELLVKFSLINFYVCLELVM